MSSVVAVYNSVLARKLSSTEKKYLANCRLGNVDAPPAGLVDSIAELQDAYKTAPTRIMNNPFLLAVYADATADYLDSIIAK